MSSFPTGHYCIYMYQRGQCPKGLSPGSVFWDDEDFSNVNDKGGTLPDGEYKKNTLIRFCCATGGDKNEPMSLPSKSPFFLLAYASEKCQMVKWAVTSVEWIHYNTENWRNHDEGKGAYPYNAVVAHPTIYYCYYRGKNISILLLSCVSVFIESLTSYDGFGVHVLKENELISYLLRFSDRIDRMKISYGNFFIQSQSRIDFLTRGKSRFIQSEISCQNESVRSQKRSRCFWRLFNLHSQKFVEFPQVYSSFLENLP